MKCILFSGTSLTPAHLKGQIAALNQAEGGGQKHKIFNIEVNNVAGVLKLLQYVVYVDW